MTKIKLTVQELKRQQEDLKRYRRFLPTLTLKKLQIQIEFNRVRALLDQRAKEERGLQEEIQGWVAVMGEEVGLPDLIQIEALERGKGNVAGVEIPLLKEIRFSEISYDLYNMPLWVDRAVKDTRRLLALRAEISVLEEQVRALERELRTTIQRVNLFEKVKIPEVVDNIRAIRIFLGDQQTGAVVRGKMAKLKVSQRSGGAGSPPKGVRRV